jgi:hypothetical protein
LHKQLKKIENRTGPVNAQYAVFETTKSYLRLEQLCMHNWQCQQHRKEQYSHSMQCSQCRHCDIDTKLLACSSPEILVGQRLLKARAGCRLKNVFHVNFLLAIVDLKVSTRGRLAFQQQMAKTTDMSVPRNSSRRIC